MQWGTLEVPYSFNEVLPKDKSNSIQRRYKIQTGKRCGSLNSKILCKCRPLLTVFQSSIKNVIVLCKNPLIKYSICGTGKYCYELLKDMFSRGFMCRLMCFQRLSWSCEVFVWHSDSSTVGHSFFFKWRIWWSNSNVSPARENIFTGWKGYCYLEFQYRKKKKEKGSFENMYTVYTANIF